MIKDILKIIKYGTHAPSGDNSQPWKFIIKNNNTIFLYNKPLVDNPILNIHQSGSFVSHGAVILNIKITASIFGYSINIIYFPDDKNKDLVAKLMFSKNNNLAKYKNDYLQYIKDRNTNRRPYLLSIDNNKLNDLLKFKDNINIKNNCKILFYTKDIDKDLIAKEISLSEEIILGNKHLHKLLYKDVIWSKKQEIKEKHGLFVDTLEFNPIQKFIFYICRKWNTIKILNKIGFAHFIATENTKIYKSSGILGFIVIENSDKRNYIEAGEIMQDLWLKTTSLNLSFQPVTGLFFLNERIETIKNDPFINENESIKINKSYNKLKNLLKIKSTDLILMSFRIGVSKKSSGRSSRREPNIILE